MASKQISTTYTTGKTVYAVIKRTSDGNLLNDADGAFVAAPADHFVTLTEDATVKGYYKKDEARTVWTNGIYDVLLYEQLTATASTATDNPPFASASLDIYSDEIVSLYTLVSNSSYGLAAMAVNISQILGIVSSSGTLRILSAITDLKNLLDKLFAQVGEMQKLVRRK